MSTKFHKGAMHGINLARAMTESRYAIYDGDFFTQLRATATAGSLGGYITSVDGTSTLILEAQLPGIAMKMGTEGSANDDAISLHRQPAVGAFDIKLNSGRVLAFESKFKVVQGTDVGIFVGLAEAGLDNDIVVDSTGAIVSKDVIGFHCVMHTTDVDIDGITRIENGDMIVGAENMSEDEDDTFHVYGFRFDGYTTIDWYYDNVIVATQTLVSTTFPTGQSLTPVFCVKNGDDGTTTQSLTIDYWQCVQLALSEDQLAD